MSHVAAPAPAELVHLRATNRAGAWVAGQCLALTAFALFLSLTRVKTGDCVPASWLFISPGSQ